MHIYKKPKVFNKTKNLQTQGMCACDMHACAVQLRAYTCMHAFLWVCVHRCLGILMGYYRANMPGTSSPSTLMAIVGGKLSNIWEDDYAPPPFTCFKSLLYSDASAPLWCICAWKWRGTRVWDALEWQNSKKMLWITPRVTPKLQSLYRWPQRSRPNV